MDYAPGTHGHSRGWISIRGAEAGDAVGIGGGVMASRGGTIESSLAMAEALIRERWVLTVAEDLKANSLIVGLSGAVQRHVRSEDVDDWLVAGLTVRSEYRRVGVALRLLDSVI